LGFLRGWEIQKRKTAQVGIREDMVPRKKDSGRAKGQSNKKDSIFGESHEKRKKKGEQKKKRTIMSKKKNHLRKT